MQTRILCTTLLAGLMLSFSGHAADQYILDKSHSRIFFEVSHLGFSNYNGMFRSFAGSFAYDQKKVEKSQVNITIDVASVDGFDDGLNDHLKGEDFFDVAKHPTAHFVSKKITKTGPDKLQVSGDLTLKGITKPLTLDVVINKSAEHPYNKKFTVGFSAAAVLDRSEYGITYGIPAVGKEIKLEIDVEAQKAAAEKQLGDIK